MIDSNSAAEALWAEAHPDDGGLLPCAVQDLRTRSVLMVAWVSKEALAATLSSGFATYWSRSRKALWEKGARSGCRQRVVTVRLDCDGDTLLYVVDAILPACHEGTDTCFSRRQIGGAWIREPEVLSAAPSRGSGVLDHLETVIAARAAAGEEAPPSYTRELLRGGSAKQAAKIREESEELATALLTEPDERVVAEAADVLYHLLVGLRGRSLPIERVFEELARRFSMSGIEEKKRRKTGAPNEG